MLKKIRDWSARLSSSSRKFINLSVILFVALLSAYILLEFVLPFLLSKTEFAAMTVSEAIASVALIVTITITAINLVVANMNKRYASKNS